MSPTHVLRLAPESVRIRGGATADEVAAILAAFERAARDQQPTRYERWRSARLAALKARPGR